MKNYPITCVNVVVSTHVTVGFLQPPTETFLSVYDGALEGMKDCLRDYSVEKEILSLGL
jgi:hypothetical protein